MVDIPKTPEELKEKDLNRANGLAGILTNIRQFSYLIVQITMPIFIMYFMYMNGIPDVATAVFGLFVFFWCLFKLRDYVRGDI